MLRLVRHLLSFASVSFLVFSLSGSGFADQITLRNGDRLSGTVVKSDGKTLVLHTDAAGDITIDRSGAPRRAEEREDGGWSGHDQRRETRGCEQVGRHRASAERRSSGDPQRRGAGGL